jgi:hypothetical protein
MDLNRANTVNKWFRIFSPCFIAVLLSLVGIIMCFLYLHKTDGWSVLAVPIFLIASGTFFATDRILKLIITSVKKLWIVQLITIAIAFLLFCIFYP